MWYNADMKVIVKKEDIAAENAALKTRITELELLVKYYEEQFRLSKHKQFGASSEKSQYDTEQLSLFDEAEITADEKVPEPELVEIEKHYRKPSVQPEKDCRTTCRLR